MIGQPHEPTADDAQARWGHLGEKWRSASTGSLAKARNRLGAGVLRVLCDRVAGVQGSPATPGVFWRSLA
ncbi:hypothetical protein ABT187_47835 [Streptomyces sp. NPDC001817]|uniref:hypothetical protein n=1 Tax=Streptomyces sp. NPDC001817 TaxID=3154398 RepID=UPI00332022BA